MQAENYIEQLQRTLEEREPIIPPEVEEQLNYLSEENHRLNLLIENYINEIKHLKVTIQASNLPKVEYRIPSDIETRLAFLAQENERLSRFVIELQNTTARVETKIEYRVPADLEAKIASLAQENSRLNSLTIQLQNRPAQQVAQQVTQPTDSNE